MKENENTTYILYIFIFLCLSFIAISSIRSLDSYAKYSNIICPECRGYGIDNHPYFWLISPPPVKLKNGKYICVHPTKNEYQLLFEQYMSILIQYNYCINCMGDGVILQDNESYNRR